jgi:hypothetical protein
MSCTIYGNTTKNGITIDDMVDDNFDYIYPIDDPDNYTYFARFSASRENPKDMPLPAIAIFSKDAIFEAIYAKILPGTIADYESGEKELIDELKDTIEGFKQFMLK